MGDKTAIEWTDATWNPTAGCSLVSPGCTNCYAMVLAHGLERRFGSKKYGGLVDVVNGHAVWNGTVRLDEEALAQPLRWKKPRRIFVNSMSDLFHESLSFDDIDRVFEVMALASRHTFQVLTKRPDRMKAYFGPQAELDGLTRDVLVEGGAQKLYHERTGEDPSMWLAVHWPLPNVWLGVSVEDQRRADERIPLLLDTSAAVRFLSCEPLLGPVDLHSALCRETGSCPTCPACLGGIDWIIVGGESGPKARACEIAWQHSIGLQCEKSGIPLFRKQLGARPTVNGKLIFAAEARDWGKGGDPARWPENLRIQQFPVAA